jgi:hypothetical protein
MLVQETTGDTLDSLTHHKGHPWQAENQEDVVEVVEKTVLAFNTSSGNFSDL